MTKTIRAYFGLCFIISLAVTSCAGVQSTSNGNLSSSPLAKVPISINDAPAGFESANFEARKTAAHKKGRWLTAELNKMHVLSTVTVPLSHPNMLHNPDVIQPICPTCDPSSPPTGSFQTRTFQDNASC